MEAKAVRRLCIIFFKGCSILSLPRPHGTSSLCTCANDHPTAAELGEEGDTRRAGGGGRAASPLGENSGGPPRTLRSPPPRPVLPGHRCGRGATWVPVRSAPVLHPRTALTEPRSSLHGWRVLWETKAARGRGGHLVHTESPSAPTFLSPAGSRWGEGSASPSARRDPQQRRRTEPRPRTAHGPSARRGSASVKPHRHGAPATPSRAGAKPDEQRHGSPGCEHRWREG